MKKLIAIMVLSSCCIFCQKPKLQDYFDLFKYTAILDQTNWMSKYVLETKNIASYSPAQLSVRLNRWGHPKPKRESLFAIYEEMDLINANKRSIELLLKNLGEQNLYDEKYLFPVNVLEDTLTTFPVRIAKYKKDKVIILTSIGYPNTYNTLRSSNKERAAKVIESIILPALMSFQKAFHNTQFKYFGISVTYGCKDFSTENNEKPETVAIITPSGFCSDYVDGKITDQELLNKSEIFFSDKDMGANIKKITISLSN